MDELKKHFKDPHLAKTLVDAIWREAGAARGAQIKLMEVCGTHTQAIFRYGIRGLLPKNIDVISGPGCPVCVTPNSFIDALISYSRKRDIIVVVFGDMIKVPGSSSSLLKERAAGADVRIIYSPIDAVDIAEQNQNKKIIFSGIGFETTVPTVAAAILEADERKLGNFYVLSAGKLLPPPLAALLKSDDVALDGLILPGHVSAIIGLNAYQFLTRDFKMPGVIAGFEPVDILASILELVRMKVSGAPSVVNLYRRAVRDTGNEKAVAIITKVFEPCDSEWRGLGIIPMSGLRLRNEYLNRDPISNLPVEIEPAQENPACICGKILRGVKKPGECPLFKKVCSPENPVGSCMVSQEGTCSAYYKYYSPDEIS